MAVLGPRCRPHPRRWSHLLHLGQAWRKVAGKESAERYPDESHKTDAGI